MYLERNGEVAFTPAEIEAARASHQDPPKAEHPWPEVEADEADLAVASRMGKGATILDARNLPMWDWCRLLKGGAGAHGEALPAQLDKAREDAERRDKERADARKNMG